MKKQTVILAILSILVLIGCGYKPSSHYAKDKIQGKVYVDIFVDVIDPKNSVIIKDAMSEIVVNRFDSQLVFDKSLADTLLYVKLDSVSMGVVQYDNKGYIKLYRATVTISVSYVGPGGKGKVQVSGTYDFSVDGTNEISEANRFEAVRQASAKALDEVISKLAIETFRKEKTMDEEPLNEETSK
ncbi:MAG: LPS assembly lipoprotein LptE [Candidatus Marinarcus sp.]|uniref:LPS assembly lipoprotein LptE n=1 Tax=Candidatus Marinarcus sp. TaxID=3100987 RepID=UPI003B0004F6